MPPQTRTRSLPPPPPWVKAPAEEPKPTIEGRIRGEEEEKILRGKIREGLEPKPTVEERIARIDDRMYARQGKRETIQGKLKGKKVTDDSFEGYHYNLPPKTAISVYKRQLASLDVKDRADNKLLVKLTGQQAGRVPATGISAEPLGPPKTARPVTRITISPKVPEAEAPGEITAGDGTSDHPYEIRESQEQFDALPSGAWFRLPGDPPGKAREKPPRETKAKTSIEPPASAVKTSSSTLLYPQSEISFPAPEGATRRYSNIDGGYIWTFNWEDWFSEQTGQPIEPKNVPEEYLGKEETMRRARKELHRRLLR